MPHLAMNVLRVIAVLAIVFAVVQPFLLHTVNAQPDLTMLREVPAEDGSDCHLVADCGPSHGLSVAAPVSGDAAMLSVAASAAALLCLFLSFAYKTSNTLIPNPPPIRRYA